MPKRNDAVGKKPLVSIVICTYNRSRELEKTLQSVVTQDYEPLEIIVIDNNSTDNTKEIVHKYSVKYILESRQGVSHARNTGLEVSRGDYLAFIDDDEIINSDWVSEILKGFQLNPKVAVVTGPVTPIYEITPPKWMPSAFHGSSHGENFLLFKNREAIGTGNSIFIKSVVKQLKFNTKLGRNKNSLLSGEDTDFVDQIYKNGYLGAYSPRAVVFHWTPAERTSLKWFMKRFFYEGLTEYMRKGSNVFWARLLKPIPNLISLLISLVSFQPKRIVKSWLRLCQTIGILYGPCYKVFSNNKITEQCS